MSRDTHGAPREGRGSTHDEGQGVHYHYHFYGNAPGPGFGGPGLGAAGTGTGAGSGGGGAGEAARGTAAQHEPPRHDTVGATPFNLHRHPGADSLVKGLVVGAGIAYLLTNDHAQRTILKAGVQLWSAVAGSFEEWKERLHDAQAEVAVETAAAQPPKPEAPTS